MTVLPIFTNHRQRTIWVQAWLRDNGLSFAAIGEANGWTRFAVSKAMNIASYPQECAIAAALGVTPEALFPERYDAHGRRLHHVRQNTPVAPKITVQSEKAA
jgi:lambda repressor-like predicted transcriptional regulator